METSINIKTKYSVGDTVYAYDTKKASIVEVNISRIKVSLTFKSADEPVAEIRYLTLSGDVFEETELYGDPADVADMISEKILQRFYGK